MPRTCPTRGACASDWTRSGWRCCWRCCTGMPASPCFDQDVFVNAVGGVQHRRARGGSGGGAGHAVLDARSSRCREGWWRSAKSGWPARSGPRRAGSGTPEGSGQARLFIGADSEAQRAAQTGRGARGDCGRIADAGDRGVAAAVEVQRSGLRAVPAWRPRGAAASPSVMSDLAGLRPRPSWAIFAGLRLVSVMATSQGCGRSVMGIFAGLRPRVAALWGGGCRGRRRAQSLLRCNRRQPFLQ